MIGGRRGVYLTVELESRERGESRIVHVRDVRFDHDRGHYYGGCGQEVVPREASDE